MNTLLRSSRGLLDVCRLCRLLRFNITGYSSEGCSRRTLADQAVHLPVAPLAAKACVHIKPIPVAPPVTTHFSLLTSKSFEMFSCSLLKWEVMTGAAKNLCC